MHSKKIFSIIKNNIDNKFCDSLINVMYLKNSKYHIASELAEYVLVSNINRLNVYGLTAEHLKYGDCDNKADMRVFFKNIKIEYSVKTGRKLLKLKSGISEDTMCCYEDDEYGDIFFCLKKDLSPNVDILHMAKKDDLFLLYLKKVSLKDFCHIKKTKNSVILKDKNNRSLAIIDYKSSTIRVHDRALEIIDYIQLGKDNSLDKKRKGESLLIDSIITSVCFCDIPTLRKIDKIVKRQIIS